ncbi:MAG: hypothetical protein KIPDCIKN_04147 [Haliscomenobacter sp.]|nr:hypothetical protein [Haliscomenobacter sp.]
MKKALLWGMWLFILSCKKEEPFFTGEKNLFNATDSTYSSSYEDALFDEIEFGIDLVVPPLDSWEEGIRIAGYGAWFNGDYVCTIYKSEPIRIQLVGRRYHFHSSTGPSFKETLFYKEGILQKTAYDSIISEMAIEGIHQMSMYLHPEMSCADCDRYSILIKKKTYKKAVCWARHGVGKHWLGEEKIGIKFHQEILELAGFPKPQVIIRKEGNKRDSTGYICYVDDRSLTSALEIRPLAGAKVSLLTKDEYKTIAFVVSNEDTFGIFDKIEFFGIQESGDSIRLKIKQ